MKYVICLLAIFAMSCKAIPIAEDTQKEIAKEIAKMAIDSMAEIASEHAQRCINEAGQ